jgi:formylglycine-generating enzyme required for sulfatase activity
MISKFAPILLACVISLASQPTSAVTIDTVPVGNAGNSGELSGAGAGGYGPDAIVGAVGYNYRIGTTEVTNAQYVEFLNAKAASDPLGLYNTLMGSGNWHGIARSGSVGSYTYATLPGRGNTPVNEVSWYDSIRFANWLHNGQGSGDTETGAYTLLGGTPMPTNGPSIARNAGATWFLPSENEWYKAAYHKNDGLTSNYFDYPTGSDTAPAGEPPPGGSNSANYNPSIVDLTNVGAYAASASPYGTFDQGGNVFEWNESSIDAFSRGTRGGSFIQPSLFLQSSDRANYFPATFENYYHGFRVATVPEPSSAMLAIIACGIVWWWRKRFK